MRGLAGLIASDILTYNEIDMRRHRAATVVEPLGAIGAPAVAILERPETAERALWSAPASSLASLTSREHEVLVLVAKGKTNFQIADGLGLSSRTVQKHLEHIYEKLDVRTRTAAAMKLALPTAGEPAYR